MVVLEESEPGARLRGLDPEGVAEIVQVARCLIGRRNTSIEEGLRLFIEWFVRFSSQ